MPLSLNEFDEKYFKANSPCSIQKYLGEDHLIDEQHPVIQELIGLHEYLLDCDAYKDFSNLSGKKLEGAIKSAQYRYKMIETATRYAIEQKLTLDFKSANKLLSFMDSYNRPAYLLQLHKIFSFDQWMKLFVDSWTNCDGCSMYISEFKEIFKNKSMPELMKTYFDEEHYNKWLELPDQVTVYRGAFESCQEGLSWSLNEEIAVCFANQYISMTNKGASYLRAMTQMNEEGMKLIDEKLGQGVSVYSMNVKKADCLLFVDRNEEEVFVPNSDKYFISELELT